MLTSARGNLWIEVAPFHENVFVQADGPPASIHAGLRTGGAIAGMEFNE